jgi:ribosome-binding factor A
MPTHRHLRVRELLKRAIGEVIRREFPVDSTGLVTVNDVEPAGDLKSATIFISILGGTDQQKRGLELLTQNRARIQGLVAKSVVLKYTPTLRFVIDDSVTRGNKVMHILDELDRQSPPAGPTIEPDPE